MTAIQIMTAGKIDRDSESFEVFNEAGEVIATASTYDMFRSKLWQVSRTNEEGEHVNILSLPRKSSKGKVVEELTNHVQTCLDVLGHIRQSAEDVMTAYKVLKDAGINSGVAVSTLTDTLESLKKEAGKRLHEILPFLKEVGEDFSWIKQ